MPVPSVGGFPLSDWVNAINRQARPEFSEHMGGLLKQIQPDTVVEVGTDSTMSLALRLARYCKRYVAITLPEDLQYAEASYEMWGGESLAGSGTVVELIGHNAMDLSSIVPQADAIVIHNVLLELEPGDTKQMWRYRRGEDPVDEESWSALRAKFDKARVEGFREFSKVASDGIVVNFERKPPKGEPALRTTLAAEKIADLARISIVPLKYDGGEQKHVEWEATIIDNRAS